MGKVFKHLILILFDGAAPLVFVENIAVPIAYNAQHSSRLQVSADAKGAQRLQPVNRLFHPFDPNISQVAQAVYRCTLQAEIRPAGLGFCQHFITLQNKSVFKACLKHVKTPKRRLVQPI